MLLDRIFAATSSPSYPVGDPALSSLFGGRAMTSSGMSVTSETAMRVSTVYACVGILSQTLAMLPIDVKRYRADGGKDVVKAHRLYKQLKYKPNKWQTSFEFREMMEVNRLLRGNAYAFISAAKGRGVNSLIPLHPDYVTPFTVKGDGAASYVTAESPPPEDGAKLFYEFSRLDGSSVILSQDEVLHIKGLSQNGIVGMNPIELHREAIGLSMATEEHGARLFTNGAQIGGVLEHPNKLSEPAFKRLKETWADNREGVGNAHKTAILEEGMKFTKIGMTGVDSQFLESRKYQVEDIARIFKVPLVMLGHSGDKNSTFASSENFFMSFVRNTMTPNCTRWEQALERDLFYPSEIGDYCIDFEMDEMMRGDAQARAQYLKARFEMASMSPDEIRSYEGENPTGTEEGKKYYLQSGMLPADMAGAVPETGGTNV